MRKVFAVTCSAIFLVALILSSMLSISSAVGANWIKHYGGAGDDRAYSIVQTSDGGYALAGFTESIGAGGSDFWLVKTDSFGGTQWEKTYGGTGYDTAFSVVQTSDGGYGLAGSAYPSGTLFVKTDSSGNMQWSQTYDGTARSMIRTSDGGYALAGVYGSDYWLVKIDSSGNIQWDKTYQESGQDYATCVIQTSDGGYALAGYTNGGNAGWDSLLVKVGASGSMQWQKTFGGQEADYSDSVVQVSDGGYVLAGSTESFDAYHNSYSSNDFCLVKTDSSGGLEWSRTYGAGGHNNYEGSFVSIVATNDGGCMFAGCNWSSTSQASACLVKVDSLGNSVWDGVYGGTRVDEAYSLIQTNDGGYALAGATSSFGASISPDFWGEGEGVMDFLLVKVDSSGITALVPTSSNGPTSSSTSSPSLQATPFFTSEQTIVVVIIVAGAIVIVIGVMMKRRTYRVPPPPPS